MKTYIEAGANDGVFQSCTLPLELAGEWSGILIEPNPDCFDACINNRSTVTNRFYNCALVSSDHKEDYITLYKHAGHSAMSGVIKRDDTDYAEEYKVPCRTLQSILDELNITFVDILYLDVEGFELSVLRGINFFRTLFKKIEVEIHSKSVTRFLENNSEKQSIIDFMSEANYNCVDVIIPGNANEKLIFRPK